MKYADLEAERDRAVAELERALQRLSQPEQERERAWLQREAELVAENARLWRELESCRHTLSEAANGGSHWP